jgi:hypothetical protein
MKRSFWMLCGALALIEGGSRWTVSWPSIGQSGRIRAKNLQETRKSFGDILGSDPVAWNYRFMAVSTKVKS